MRRLFYVFVTATLFASIASAAAFLSLAPGAISGVAGADVGWSLSITNDSGWIVVSQVGFCQGTGNTLDLLQTGPCTTDYAAVGSFADLTTEYLTNHPASPGNTLFTIGPGAVFNQTFALGTPGTGIGPFTINPAATVGSAVTGQILVVFDVYTEDPNVNPEASVSGNNLMTADAQVTVTSDIPEPATLALAGFALLSLGLWRTRRT